MNTRIYGIFFFLLTMLPSASWACVAEENACEETGTCIYEDEDQACIEAYDETYDISCDFDNSDEEEQPFVPEDAEGVVKRIQWQHIVCFSDQYTSSRYRTFTIRDSLTLRPATDYNHPPRPAYYNFIFRYCPF